jgi:hypothetical protein
MILRMRAVEIVEDAGFWWRAQIMDSRTPLYFLRFSRADLQSQPAFPSEFPFDAATLALYAGDELADAIFQNGLPGY